jgi:hypothetical protein
MNLMVENLGSNYSKLGDHIYRQVEINSILIQQSFDDLKLLRFLFNIFSIIEINQNLTRNLLINALFLIIIINILYI